MAGYACGGFLIARGSPLTWQAYLKEVHVRVHFPPSDGRHLGCRAGGGCPLRRSPITKATPIAVEARYWHLRPGSPAMQPLGAPIQECPRSMLWLVDHYPVVVPWASFSDIAIPLLTPALLLAILPAPLLAFFLPLTVRCISLCYILLLQGLRVVQVALQLLPNNLGTYGQTCRIPPMQS